MLSHHQLSLSKPCESYQHVKDGESWALLGNREPQTNWWPWLTFMWPSIHAKSVSSVQVWGRAKFEGNGACLSMAFVAGCRWAAVRVISPSECDPGSSSLGYCTGVQHGTKPDKDCWWETGQESWKEHFIILEQREKGKEMYLSAFVVWKWKEFLRKKKFHHHFQARTMAQILPEGPGGILGTGKDSEGSWLCCAVAEPPWLCYFCLILCTLQLSSDFSGRTWWWGSDDMVSLENASGAFYCF